MPGFVLSDAAQARHRNYAEADSTDEEKRWGLLPGFVPPALSDAAQVVARLRSAGFAGRRASAARNYAGAYLP